MVGWNLLDIRLIPSLILHYIFRNPQNDVQSEPCVFGAMRAAISVNPLDALIGEYVGTHFHHDGKLWTMLDYIKKESSGATTAKVLTSRDPSSKSLPQFCPDIVSDSRTHPTLSHYPSLTAHIQAKARGECKTPPCIFSSLLCTEKKIIIPRKGL